MKKYIVVQDDVIISDYNSAKKAMKAAEKFANFDFGTGNTTSSSAYVFKRVGDVTVSPNNEED